MNLNLTIKESIDTLWNQKQYPASSSWPRKDFVPVGAKNEYNFPYQKGAPPIFPPTPSDPEHVPSMPWPLQTVSEDIADSYVYLWSAYKKMQRCVEENPSPSKIQKQQISLLMKLCKFCLKTIKQIGLKINKVADLTHPVSS
jgi:hypothetical protein